MHTYWQRAHRVENYGKVVRKEGNETKQKSSNSEAEHNDFNKLPKKQQNPWEIATVMGTKKRSNDAVESFKEWQ
jgi:hypothetical protein